MIDDEANFAGELDSPPVMPPTPLFDNDDDFIHALGNNLSIGFGVAAIALNRACEDCGLQKPDPIFSEVDQCVALIYQIRNAFAHDIATPKWAIRKPRYRREYVLGGKTFDLRDLDGRAFEWKHVGGPDGLVWIRNLLAGHHPEMEKV